MKALNICVSAGLMALAALSNPDVARAQISPESTKPEFTNCAWPLELSPEGFGNFLAPDDQARYWLMPFDDKYKTTPMKIQGSYPNARYFSFVAYNGDENGRPATPADVHLYDEIITPDGDNSSRYTVYITRNDDTADTNTIKVTKYYAWVLLRIYVPSRDKTLGGQALTGGVPLPTITLGTEVLKPCPIKAPSDPSVDYYPVRSINKLADLRAFFQVLFPSDFDIMQPRDWDETAGDRLWFAPAWNPPVLLLPNPDNKYIMMQPGPYQPGRVIVIHGKAPSFPDTYDGSPKRSRGSRKVDMRYWSVCNNDLVLPVPVVRCLTDQGLITEDGYYTIVITNDLLRPDWLRPNVNWLPWGDEQYPKAVFFRHMIPVKDESEYENIPFPYAIQKVVIGCWEGKENPENYKNYCDNPNAVIDFTLPDLPPRADITEAGPYVQQIMGDYYPVAAWCDKSTFKRGGWRACLKD